MKDLSTCPLGVGRGVLPSSRLMGVGRRMGSHFHDWIGYYGLALLQELLEWGHRFSGFGGGGGQKI